MGKKNIKGVLVTDTLAIKPAHKGGEWHLIRSNKEYAVIHIDAQGKQTGGTYWNRVHGGRDISPWAEKQAIATFHKRPVPLPAIGQTFEIKGTLH